MYFSFLDLSMVWYGNCLWDRIPVQSQHKVRRRFIEVLSDRVTVTLIFKPGWCTFWLYSSTSGSAGGFRQNDPSLRKWQSLSHLAPEGATRTFSPSPGAELRATRGESSFRQAEGVQWLQDAHARLDTQLDRLRTKNAHLNYNITTAQLLDMKHKVRLKKRFILNVYVN